MDNSYSRAANEYKKQSIITSSKEELTLSLYNGCIKFINDAIKAVDSKDTEAVNDFAKKAQSIILELACSLNMDYEVSYNMRNLYDYIYEKLVDGNIKKDTADFHEALLLVKEFRNVWFEAMKIAKEEQKNDGERKII